MEETKQILIAITELQANVKNMGQKIDEINKMGASVVEATQSVKSAHNRIDDLKTDFSDKLRAQKEDYEDKIEAQGKEIDSLKDGITWLKRAVIGGAITAGFGLLLFLLTYLITKGGS